MAGRETVFSGLKSGEVSYLICAQDLSERSVREVQKVINEKPVFNGTGLAQAEIGHAIGRGVTGVLGLLGGDFKQSLPNASNLLQKWMGWSHPVDLDSELWAVKLVSNLYLKLVVGIYPNGVSKIMAKIRVFTLAKEMGISSKDLIAQLARKGITVKTASSSVDKELAIKSLGADKEEEAAVKRPRTMLRRRRKEVEETPEVVAVPSDVSEAVDPEPVAVAEVSTSEEAVADVAATASDAQETPNNVEATEAPTASDDTPTSDAAAVEVKDAAEEKAEEASAPAEEPAVEEEAAARNVVRHIDPDAIRNRLQGEGRHFKPSYNKVREIKVYSDNQGNVSRMVDMTSVTAAPSTGGGARPGKKKNEKVAYGRERREGRSGGGRDLWQKPGRKKKTAKSGKQTEITQAAAHKRVIEITDTITVSDLAHRMAVKSSQVIGSLMGMGMMVTVNQGIDYETAAIVAEEFEFEVKNVAVEETDLDPETRYRSRDVTTCAGGHRHGTC